MQKKLLISILFITTFGFGQNTYVPDDNFEQALIDLGYDDVIDDYVLTANISGVTTLDVGEKEISDLTGIEDLNGNEVPDSAPGAGDEVVFQLTVSGSAANNATIVGAGVNRDFTSRKWAQKNR